MLDFRIESREVLAREAHTTLQWLFAMVLGASGFVVSLIRPASEAVQQPASMPWWLIGPMSVAVIAASGMAVYLLQKAMRIGEIASRGNEPRNIATDHVLGYPEEWMRMAEAASIQDRITEIRADNERIADAINRARFAIILIAPLTVIASAVWWTLGG